MSDSVSPVNIWIYGLVKNSFDYQSKWCRGAHDKQIMWYLKAAESFNHFIFFCFFFFFLQMTAEAMLRLANDPVLPFYPLDIALDVQNKLKGNSVHKRLLSSLGPSTSFKIHQCTQNWKDKCLNWTVLLGNWELVKYWYPYLKSWYNKH